VRITCLVVVCAACGSDAYSGPTATVTGNVHEYDPDGVQAPIAGAEVCVLDQPSIECAVTDADGNYSLKAPTGETALVISADTYSTSVVAATVGSGTMGSHRLITRSDLLYIASTSGITLKSGLGLVVLQFHGRAGVTTSISPAKGQGPIYFNAQQVPDPSLPETSASGFVAFTNLPEDEYTVAYELAGSTFTIDPPGGWPEGGGARMPVVADAISGMTIAVQ
jgi:hypothetical protein